MTNKLASNEIVKTARALLDGDTGVVPAIRIIVPLLRNVRPEVGSSEEALALVAVESETDEFPLGEQRSLWAAAALAQQDEELEHYMREVRADVEKACRFLIETLQR